VYSRTVVREGSALRGWLDAFNRRFTMLHNRVYVASGGWLGHHWAWVPSLVLFTRGRKSGQQRSSVLVYARDGGTYLVVASNFGGDRPPAWLLNLEADPQVSINVGRRRHRATAEAVWPDDPRYERLFGLVNANNKNRYQRYRALTERPIPIVVLTPTEA
jgi:deazaflavin-dependent oxidoreductase (nitroreductase family)